MNSSLSQPGFTQYSCLSRTGLALIVSAIAIAIAALVTVDPPTPPFVIVSLVIASIAAAVDLRTRMLPDAIVVAAAIPPIIFACAAAIDDRDLAMLDAVLAGAVAFAAPLLVAHLLSPASLGFGDVKLAAALGAALGLVDPRLGVLALCLGAGTTSVVALLQRHHAVPFGPGLVVGAIAAAGLAAQLGGVWT